MEKKSRIACILSIVAIVLFACGKVVGPMDAPDFTLDPNAITIGYFAPFTGADAASTPPEEVGVRLAVKEINEAGGVLGKKLQIVKADDRCDANYGAKAVEKLMSYTPVALIGSDCSSATVPALDYLKSHSINIPVISPDATSTELTGYYKVNGSTNFFRIEPSDAFQAHVLAKLIQKAGISKVGVIYISTETNGSPSAYGQALYKAFVAAFGQGNITGAVGYQSGTTIFKKAQIDALFSGNPDAILLVSYTTEGAGISRAIATYRPDLVGKVKLFCSDANYGPDFVNNGDLSVLNGATGVVAGTGGNAQDKNEYVTLAAPYVNKNNAYTTGYDAVYLLAFAMVKGGDTTPEKIKPNIISVSGGSSGTGTLIRLNEFSKGVSILKSGGLIHYVGPTGATNLDSNGDPSTGVYSIWGVEKGEIKTKDTITYP